MKTDHYPQENVPPNPYPQGFVYGQGVANPRALSLSGLKIARALQALQHVRGAVLELGCGAGQYLRALRQYRPDLQLYAVDLDAQAIEQVKSIPRVVCAVAHVSALPYPENKFSAVLGFDILEHVQNPGQVLRESARVLVPGGVLHLYVPCEGNPGTVYMKKGHTVKARYGGHQQQYTTQQLVHMVQTAGFEILRLRHADYYLTQQFDYMFFSLLAKSSNPELLWAAQALRSGGGWRSWGLRLVRRMLSAISWLEGTVRRSAHRAMGVHLTASKR